MPISFKKSYVVALTILLLGKTGCSFAESNGGEGLSSIGTLLIGYFAITFSASYLIIDVINSYMIRRELGEEKDIISDKDESEILRLAKLKILRIYGLSTSFLIGHSLVDALVFWDLDLVFDRPWHFLIILLIFTSSYFGVKEGIRTFRIIHMVTLALLILYALFYWSFLLYEHEVVLLSIIIPIGYFYCIQVLRKSLLIKEYFLQVNRHEVF